jgi:hypothetical protein
MSTGLSLWTKHEGLPRFGARTTTRSGLTAAWGAYRRRNLPSSIASALAMLLGLSQAKKSINLQLGLPSF